VVGKFRHFRDVDALDDAVLERDFVLAKLSPKAS